MDQIKANYPGQIAAIEWHVNSGYPLYCAEARQRWFSYPPPYYSGGNWYYATPWAWIDGKNRGYQYSSWDYWVQQKLGEPAEVGINLTGSYLPGAGAGELAIEMVNETSAPIDANLYVVITEDSINSPAPNGDQWHNHVCRDYVTGIAGTSVTVPAMGADTAYQPFTIESDWVEANCNLVVFLQNPTQQSDSSRPVYQGGIVKLLELTGVAEGRRTPAPRLSATGGPNPVRDRAEVRFTAAPGSRWQLAVYSSAGRLVAEESGTARGPETVRWEPRDAAGRRLAAGIYAWRLTASDGTAQGKFVLAD
ncbi:MAG: Omp28-related outer membrane protein [bacterium]